MTSKGTADFDDMQALARFGHGHLPYSRFLLLGIRNRQRAGRWLQQSPISSAIRQSVLPEFALQIAFTPAGLKALGLSDEVLAQFSDEFLVGISGDQNRSRRLGDIGSNAPDQWQWGHHDCNDLHVLLLMYSRNGEGKRFDQLVDQESFQAAFSVLHTLPTNRLRASEPFGFVDGISQPEVDWQEEQATDLHARHSYSNLLASGEIMLGHANEYGQYTRRPFIKEQHDALSTLLPAARSTSGMRDFGLNGSYLVLRQLQQHVDRFWHFAQAQHKLNKDSRAKGTEQFASLMVGRDRNGNPLISTPKPDIPGVSASDPRNQFDFDQDPHGLQCPLGAHVRRSNPRTGDFPATDDRSWKRLLRMLGLRRSGEHEDLIASSRFHRLLRRGRTYGPDDEFDTESCTISVPADREESGLQFICLAANILRQFEFVQSAWSESSSFGGTREQRDPLTGHRLARANGTRTDSFMHAQQAGPQHKTPALPEFVTVRGGGYFFMPGLRAIRYLSRSAGQETVESNSDQQGEYS